MTNEQLPIETREIPTNINSRIFNFQKKYTPKAILDGTKPYNLWELALATIETSKEPQFLIKISPTVGTFAATSAV